MGTNNHVPEMPYYERGSEDDDKILRAVLYHENFKAIQNSFPQLQDDIALLGISEFILTHASCAAGEPITRPNKRQYAVVLGNMRKSLKQARLNLSESEAVYTTLVDLANGYLTQNHRVHAPGEKSLGGA
jgi:hypothetical protein